MIIKVELPNKMVIPLSSQNTEPKQPKFNESDMKLNLKVPNGILNNLSEANSMNEINKKLENVTSPKTFFTAEEESSENSKSYALEKS